VIWVLDHLDDLDADFRTFYRIDGVGDEQWPSTLSAPRFFSLAYRVSAFGGVMAARAQADAEPVAASRSRTDRREVPGTTAAIMADPDLRDLFDH